MYVVYIKQDKNVAHHYIPNIKIRFCSATSNGATYICTICMDTNIIHPPTSGPKWKVKIRRWLENAMRSVCDGDMDAFASLRLRHSTFQLWTGLTQFVMSTDVATVVVVTTIIVVFFVVVVVNDEDTRLQCVQTSCSNTFIINSILTALQFALMSNQNRHWSQITCRTHTHLKFPYSKINKYQKRTWSTYIINLNLMINR